MIAANLNQTTTYVLEEDRDAKGDQLPGATTFILRTLSADQRAIVEDKLTQGAAGADGGDVAVNVRTAAQNVEAVRFGIAGWDHMTDHEGNLVEPKFRAKGRTQALHDESLDLLIYHHAELAAEVKRFNRLTEEEEGNSASSPSWPSLTTPPTTRSSRSSFDARNAKADPESQAETHAGDATAAVAAR